jgi:Family of unknown function (DUF5681)
MERSLSCVARVRVIRLSSEPRRLPNREPYHTVAQHQHDDSTHMPINLWQPGQSGNPAGRVRGSRNKLSEEVICALLRDFREHGQKAIAKVRREQPGVYLRVLALLCPREHQVQHSSPLKDLTDEQLEAMIEYIETSLAAQAGAPAKMIEGATALPVLEPPNCKPNRLMMEVDTAIGPQERKPRKRVPSPASA